MRKRIGVYIFVCLAISACSVSRIYNTGFNSGMLPLDFYGKIVDQHGVPVRGAKMVYELEGKFLAPGKGFGKTITDDEGRFEIHSEGGALKLYGIEHPKARLFYPLPSHSIASTVHYSPQNESIRILGHQETKGGKNLIWIDTLPNKPHVFIAWRVKKYEDVQSGAMKNRIACDGRVYTYDFTKKDRWGDIVLFPEEGVSEGQLRVSCRRAHISSRWDHEDWSISISAVDGGIQATDDYYQNMAPESGYEPTIKIGSETNSPDYTPVLFGQRFYFTANNRRVYGSIYLDIDANSEPDACGLDISLFKINTNGSRNLAIRQPGL